MFRYLVSIVAFVALISVHAQAASAQAERAPARIDEPGATARQGQEAVGIVAVLARVLDGRPGASPVAAGLVLMFPKIQLPFEPHRARGARLPPYAGNFPLFPHIPRGQAATAVR